MSSSPGSEGASPPQGEVTLLLEAMSAGEAGASEQVADMIYAELRNLAGACLRGERVDHTLQPTALVSEAWMRLAGQAEITWQNRAHFMGIASLAMRRVLVEHARKRSRDKRGGGARREALKTAFAAEGERGAELDLLALDEGLEALKEHSARAARVVELRFFAGLTEQESAEVLGVTRATVARDWVAARAWLMGFLADADDGGGRA